MGVEPKSRYIWLGDTTDMVMRPIFVAGVLALVVSGSSLATAQSLATPTEFPPTSYTGSQYVDSSGCAFIRAGQGALVNWVPRVTRNREQLCGFVPTFEAAAPEPQEQSPVITLDNPIENRAVAEVAPPVGQRTLAEVCEGRSGPLDGFVTADGSVVNCGPEEVVAAEPEVAPTPPLVIVPVAEPAPVEQAPAPRQVVRAPAPAPASAPAPVRLPEPMVIAAPEMMAAPAPVLRRVTRAEICAEIAATGKTVIDSATDAPVVCPAVVAAVNGAPAAPGAPTVASAPAAPALQAPAAQAAAPSRPQVTRGTSGLFSLFGPKPVPASNPDPARVAGEVIKPPRGYEAVWTDGRINPQRGLTRITPEEAAAMGLAVR